MVLGPALKHIDARAVVYAALSLTVVRMVPVALSLIGSKLPGPAVALIGWFGPRGLASIVFVLVAVETVQLPHASLIIEAASLTVAASILLHGVTANPFVDRYSEWQDRQGPAPRPTQARG
jgi:NhaP-type Na+/H+ or K+/H+ antiporter